MGEQSPENYLTVETGEVYQPVRLTYSLNDKTILLEKLEQLRCITKEPSANLWTWYWNNECDDLHFELDHQFQKKPEQPVRLGTISIRDDIFYIYLPSFKRACVAVPFFHKILTEDMGCIRHVDFINKIFTNHEMLPRKLNEIFKEEELSHASHQRVDIYKSIEKQCESIPSVHDALDLLSDVIKNEAKWNLPYVERYVFAFDEDENQQVIFLAFYLFMRSRELVAIKRASGQFNYQLSDAVNDTIELAFGCKSTDKNLSALFFRAQALFRGYMTQRTVNVFC